MVFVSLTLINFIYQIQDYINKEEKYLHYMLNKKLFLGIILLLLFLSIIFIFDFIEYFTLSSIQNSRELINSFYSENPIKTIILFFVIYLIITATSIPGAAVMTILAGALFGLILGTVIVSFASTIGATLAMLASRYLFNNYVHKKLPKVCKKVDKKIEEEGNFYLFSLRLIPLFPFFIINLAMGLTKIKAWNFFWVSQLGMLAGTIVYVNAGNELWKLTSVSGILSPSLIFAFVLLGLFPIVAKKFVEFTKGNKQFINSKN